MSIANPPKFVTIKEFLAIPEDGIDRELIRGEIRERPMTKRNRYHAKTEAKLAKLVGNWLDKQAEPRGDVFSGEVGCILSNTENTCVGIDVAYFHTEAVTQQTDETSMMRGSPILAIEILSPSDTVESINEKIDLYLDANVRLIWIVEPQFQTVTVHQPNTPPQLFNITQTFSADPQLPGLTIAVKDIFE